MSSLLLLSTRSPCRQVLRKVASARVARQLAPVSRVRQRAVLGRSSSAFYARSKSTVATPATGKPGGTELWRHNLVGDLSLRGPRDDTWYTGPVPSAAPGVGLDGALRVMKIPNLDTATRKDLLDYFDNCWAQTECLFSSLNGEEAFYNPPKHQLRHPFIFYYGHPATLYINKLRVAGALSEPIDAQLEQDLQTGVDEMSWDDLSDGGDRWVPVQRVKEYRAEAYNLVRDIILTHPDLEPDKIATSDVAWALVMSFEHERIHIETSSVLMREFPLSMLQRPENYPANHPTAARESTFEPVEGKDYPAIEKVSIAGRDVVVGKSEAHKTFGWDNEYGKKTVTVPDFETHSNLISNGLMFEFIAEGGYRDQSLWSKDGWGWRTFRNVKWPTFWEPIGPHGLQQYRLRTVFEEIPMQWDWPAVVNHHEAKAVCNWLSRREGREIGAPDSWRLSTEAEHHLMRDASVAEVDPADYSGEAMLKEQTPFGLNGNMAYGSESPVDAAKPASTGLRDTFGNVWHLCEDHFSALPGFEANYMYDDFSAPCFDGRHNIIMGGSFISGGDLISKYARYHFRPHFFQHSGVRPVRSVNPTAPLHHHFTCTDSPGPNVGAVPCCTTKEQAVQEERPQHIPVAAGDTGMAAEVDVYETQRVVDAYLNMHYGFAEEVLGTQKARLDAIAPSLALNFPQQCARITAQSWQQVSKPEDGAETRALDLGCAVGRSTFELARTFDKVVGIDYSQAFVQAAKTIKEDGTLPYWRLDEGELTTRLSANFANQEARDRCDFLRGDATNLSPTLGQFDAVLAANLLCRLPEPCALLKRLPTLVKSGGVVAFLTPWSWDEQYTPRHNWLGGYNELDGEEVVARKSQEALQFEMEKIGFSLVAENDVPLVLREHARRYQYIISHCSVFKNEAV